MSKPFRICLIMQGSRRWIAGTEYVKNIILSLTSLPLDVRSTFEVSLICSRSLDPSLYDQIHSRINNIHYQEVDLAPPTLFNRIRWKITETLLGNDPRLEAFFKRQKVDFVYPYFTRYDGHKSFRSAAWISDFQHKFLPQFFTKEGIRKRDLSFLRIARDASIVILSSKAAKADFQKFFPEAAEKSKVLPFRTYPVSTWYEPDSRQTQQEYSLSDRFFLVSNQFWQHKNHLVLFKALKILKDKSIYPIVVCTGHIYDSRKLDYTDMVLQTIHKFGLARQVYLLGLIPRFEQVQLMRRSLAVVQPSLFEGWSTVVEDARCFRISSFVKN